MLVNQSIVYIRRSFEMIPRAFKNNCSFADQILSFIKTNFIPENIFDQFDENECFFVRSSDFYS